MRGKGYSSRLKQMALAKLRQNGGNCHKTAQQLGVPTRTLAGWRDRDTSKRKTDDFKGMCLAAADQTDITAAAGDFGVSPNAVRQWQRGEGVNDDSESERQEFNRRFIREAEGLIERSLAEAGLKLSDANYSQIISGLSQLIDRRQLLSGAPTQIQQTQINLDSIKSDLLACAVQAGLDFADVVGAAIEDAQERGDHELERLLPTLLAPAIDVPTYTDLAAAE